MTQKTVLIVDDERPIVSLLARLAQGVGARTEVAYNGKDALEKIRLHKPDLVLLDLIMPIMSGEEVLAVMETDPQLQDIPVIVISTKAAVGAGVEREVPHLRKPFEPTDVKRLIREHLGLSDGTSH
ncbi:MAG: response regulator [Armatimonadota bacterium]